MIVLITGGSGSGKSAFAEETVMRLGAFPRYYIATMDCLDVETRQRISRHRKMREGKSFTTLEQPVHLEQCVLPQRGVALVECISNLVANERYSPKGFARENPLGELPAHLFQGIRKLASQCEHLVIVSHEVGSDGIAYDASTMEYIRIMGTVHAGLAMMTEEVYEVVYGIPLRTK